MAISRVVGEDPVGRVANLVIYETTRDAWVIVRGAAF